MAYSPYIIVPATGVAPADEWLRLAVELHFAGQLAEAERYYHYTLRLNPSHAVALSNLAVLLLQTRRLNDALLTNSLAVLHDPMPGYVYTNRAFLCLEAHRLEDAWAAACSALECYPLREISDRKGYCSALLGAACAAEARADAALALSYYRAVLAVEPQHPVASDNACFVQTLLPLTAEDLGRERTRWHGAHAYQGPREPHTNDRTPGRVLRVGYVGGDFKQHSAAAIFGAVILQHTPQVEAYLYATLKNDPLADGHSWRFQEAVGGKFHRVNGKPEVQEPGRWRDISTLPDDQAEALIRQDKIDILVDLAAHSEGGRLPLFTRRPAPVQVTAWGFAHGTGCPEIDYFFADSVAVPQAERVHYAEKIALLPCIVGYFPPAEYKLPGISPLPLLQNGQVTFGCYARYVKLSSAHLRACETILERVPNSRLLFKDQAFWWPDAVERVRRTMSNIAPERLLFGLSGGHTDHLLACQHVDLFLDPFPHGGGLGALEQLYMGVPLVTLYGQQPAGRTAASVLHLLGHDDWVAHTTEEYIATAVRLAGDTTTLLQARLRLREELLASPVVKGYAGAVEATYRTLWREWCQR